MLEQWIERNQNIMIRFIHSNEQFFPISRAHHRHPIKQLIIERKKKNNKSNEISSLKNREAQQIKTCNTIHDLLCYRMCICWKGNRYGLGGTPSNSKTQTRPSFCPLFLRSPWAGSDEIFQWFCFPVSGPACFFQELSQPTLFIFKIRICNTKFFFSQF